MTLNQIQQALENDEFEFYYQPQLCLFTGKTTGAEALIRWVKADGQIIPPNDFLPLAESTGFITQMTERMVERFLHDASVITQIHPDISLSMNCSVQDMNNPRLFEKMAEYLKTHMVDPKNIAIEVTETSVPKFTNLNALAHFSRLNIPLIMDDFGQGFANLNALVDMPFSTIKLDRGLLKNIMNDPKRLIVVKNNILMAHRLGMDVIAEGVEVKEVYDFLQSVGCNKIQGFLIAKPMKLVHFIEFLTQNEHSGLTGSPIGHLHLINMDHIEWRRHLLDQCFKFKPYQDNVDTFIARREEALNDALLNRWCQDEGRTFRNQSIFETLNDLNFDLNQLAQKLIHEAVKTERDFGIMVDLSKKISTLSLVLLSTLHELEHGLNEALLNPIPPKTD